MPEATVIPLDEPLDLRDPTEHVSAARVVDANANRAREALRVLDDYCRFVLDDAVLTEEIKAARHALVGVLERVPPNVLIESRDTPGDVGTGITVSGEMVRRSPTEVAGVNLKRLQEALRSLEEFGKLLSPDLAGGFEAIRYRTYSLERALVIGRDARDRLQNGKLYVLVSAAARRGPRLDDPRSRGRRGRHLSTSRKGLTDRELWNEPERPPLTRETRTLFILNDRPTSPASSKRTAFTWGRTT